MLLLNGLARLRKPTRRLVTGLAVLLLATIAVPTSAHADGGAPPCYGSSCVGQSPYIENSFGTSCVDDAVNVAGSAVYVEGDADVVVRWSAFCHANWVTWETGTGYSPGYDQFYVQSADGHQEFNNYRYYTYMVDGTQTVENCSRADSSSSYFCLGWF